MSSLLPVSVALENLLKAFSPTPLEEIDLRDAYSRILGEQVQASQDYPHFANSSMDGFALRTEDITGASQQSPVTLIVVEDIPAGHVPQRVLKSGQAARIMTGAPLPQGANGVIPVEDTDFPSRQPGLPPPEKVDIFRSLAVGDYVRPRGEDFRRGSIVLTAGTYIRPQELGLLAMLGIPRVKVHRRPRVAILTTGDELLQVNAPLTPGKIYESNSYILAAQVESCGADPRLLGIIPDHPDAVQTSLEQAFDAGVDLIVSSAGVSVGAYDFVRQVVEAKGRLDFWRVNMRPGKPLAFGAYGDIPFIGLPGNPVSTFISFEIFARPAIFKMAGWRNWRRRLHTVTLSEGIESDGRESYLRAVVYRQGEEWLAHLSAHQGSGNLQSLTAANAILIVPSEVKSLPSGTRIESWWLDDNLAN